MEVFESRLLDDARRAALSRGSLLRGKPGALSALMLALVLSAPLGGCAGGAPVAQAPDASHPQQPSQSQPQAPLTVLPHPALSQVGSPANIADIAERVTPSVVNISATKIGRKVEFEGTPFGDPFFRRFFPDGDPPKRRNEYGLGSGVIVTDPGAPGEKLVLTNHHVIADADRILVRTASGERLNATVLGSDPQSDLAVLKLAGDTSALQALAFGSSARLRLGDIVLAVGNPFGVGQTVTMGIVSAKGRSNMGIVDYEDFIQTDAAINPGNSGGALIDMEGNLVGINTAILARGGGNVGIGFAIPSSMASKILHSLIEYGEVRRGWLGVVIQDLDAELARALGVAATHGVVVSDMEKTGPGAQAGIQQGDVIQSVDGRQVDTTGALRNAIAAAGAGKSVKLGVLRGKQALTLEVKLGEAKAKGPRGKSRRTAPSNLGGVKVDDLTPELRSRLHLPDTLKGGVIVKSVESGSTAELSGIQRGDVVASVDKQPIKSVGDFERALSKHAPGTKALLLVYRGGRAMYMLLEAGKK
ncbi:MAG: Do family serine endopeptidase [Myxococcales bacterium]|nr:Do family serine endopeptidase [Myxococcales bacterium]